jgi:radical SAM superfamily enzyme YgiQ (UPF0313 family)
MNPRKRVLLCNPPFPRKVKGMPLSLMHLAGSLRHPSVRFKGEVCLLDLNVKNEPKKELMRTLEDFRPTHFGITRFTPTVPETMEILRKVKESDRGIVTITGGPHEIFHHAKTKAEAEGVIDHIVKDFDGIAAFHGILDLESTLTTLEVLPAYDLILQDRDKYQFEGLYSHPMAQAITAMGCNGSCTFCRAGPYRAADFGFVRRTLRRLRSLGFGAVHFDDGNFVMDPERTSALSRHILRHMDLEWGCQTRADSSLHFPMLLHRMHESGCRYICTALESADQGVLDSIAKGLKVADVSKAVTSIKDAGMKVGLYVMFRHPIELRDPGIATNTLDTIESLKPDFLSISMYANYYGRIPLEPVNRENEWLYFDEGWGAQHPASLSYALRIKELIEERKMLNPDIWDRVRIF